MTENGGCYVMYKLGEGNFRVVVVSLVMLSYALAGAGLFQAIETNNEDKCRENYLNLLDSFMKKYPDVNQTELEELLSVHANAAMNGHLMSHTERWDYMGALYYVVTLLTTIGFGMTTPSTDAGKITTIIYGFFGCSLNVLCMNLLLERHIIFFTKIMKVANEMFRKLKSKVAPNVVEMESGIKPTEEWKPPIAKLLMALLVTLIVIMLAMAAAYAKIEDWSYLDSFYYCFVTYTTIGFGDYVAQQEIQGNTFYSILNGISIYVGTTIMYSVYNVLSILLKDLVVKFCSWITISCYQCYYDPNIGKVAERGRRTNALTISRKPSTIGFHSPQRLNTLSPSRTPSVNLTQRQYERNLANITQEYQANNRGGSLVSQSSNPDVKVNPSTDTPITNVSSNIPPMTINSPSEPIRSSIHSVGIDIAPSKHTFLRIESFKRSDFRHLSLTRRESDLVLGRLDRPKSRIQREAGGMNAVRSALEQVTAEVSGEVSEDTDEYL